MATSKGRRADHEMRRDESMLDVNAASARIDSVLRGQSVDQWLTGGPGRSIGNFGLMNDVVWPGRTPDLPECHIPLRRLYALPSAKRPMAGLPFAAAVAARLQLYRQRVLRIVDLRFWTTSDPRLFSRDSTEKCLPFR
jgi:hypothetical protein